MVIPNTILCANKVEADKMQIYQGHNWQEQDYNFLMELVISNIYTGGLHTYICTNLFNEMTLI